MSSVPSPSLRLESPTLLQKFRQLYARRETIKFLVSTNLKSGDRDKFLGRIWGLLDPLLFMLVYLVVFGYFFNQARRGPGGISEFIIYLLCGVLSWRFFDGAVSAATTVISTNRGLIHEINFPKSVLPISICLSRLADFLYGVVILIGVVLFTHYDRLTIHVLWVPLIILLQLIFTLGLSFIVAAIGTFFADTANIVSVMLRFWFYASPIFYHVKKTDRGIVPADWEPIYMLNPVACFFEAYRNCFLRGLMPDLHQLLYVSVVSLVMVTIGFAVFTRLEGQFAKYV